MFVIAVLALAASPPALAGGLVVSSGFGVRIDPIRHIIGNHRGIDLPGPAGTPILAAASGIVRIAGWRSGYGILVELEHEDGCRTRYGHLSRAVVEVGDRVVAGDIIGAMGATGRATGNHLHFEYLVAGRARDPLHYLTGVAPSSVPTASRTASTIFHRSLFATSRVVTPSGGEDRLPDGQAADRLASRPASRAGP